MFDITRGYQATFRLATSPALPNRSVQSLPVSHRPGNLPEVSGSHHRPGHLNRPATSGDDDEKCGSFWMEMAIESMWDLWLIYT